MFEFRLNPNAFFNSNIATSMNTLYNNHTAGNLNVNEIAIK